MHSRCITLATSGTLTGDAATATRTYGGVADALRRVRCHSDARLSACRSAFAETTAQTLIGMLAQKNRDGGKSRLPATQAANAARGGRDALAPHGRRAVSLCQKNGG